MASRSRSEKPIAPGAHNEMKPIEAFAGPESLRVRGETPRFILTLLFFPVTVTILGFFLQSTLSLHSLVLILIGAMLYVALSRGRFLGGSVRIRDGRFGEVFAIVQECAHVVGIATPHVFLREDPFVPIVAIGTGEPYAIVISSQWIEHFSPGELRFLVGREVAHIACGHTRITSLLSANGRENPVVAIAFGAWLRIIEFTADRVGLICCGSVHDAFSAIAVSTFQHIGRKIDLQTFAEQRRELDAEPTLRFGEWLGATPYATNRIAALAMFAKEPLFVRWSARFAERRAAPAIVESHASLNSPGFWRRASAFIVDISVVSALMPSATPRIVAIHAANVAKRAAIAGASPDIQAELTREGVPPAVASTLGHVASGNWSGTTDALPGLIGIVFLAYVIVLVAFAGQTLGMMICDIRVIGATRERIGLGRTLWRYLCFALSIPVVVGIFAIFRRVQPFERWSRTRLVSGSTRR